MSEAINNLSPFAKCLIILLVNIPFLSVLGIYDAYGAIGPILEREGTDL